MSTYSIFIVIIVIAYFILLDFFCSQTNTKINALLMTLSLDARGLYLTEVTNVIFMEPVINKADEYRAINRMHSTKYFDFKIF